jgi:hypothetical protein
VTETTEVDVTSRGEPLPIFVGVDLSQLVAFRVLEYSIRKSASIPVEVHPMLEFSGRVPAAPEHRSRTAFSFCRFTIPERCGFRGRALYLDADMLVFADVAELAAMEFGPHTILRTEPCASDGWADYDPVENFGAQSAVMLLDCSRLDWRADAIVAGLDEGRYTYEQLMANLCIVDPAEIADCIPSTWNDLERYDPEVTKLIHYTVVPMQPWKVDTNPLGALWTTWFEEAVAAGAVPVEEIEACVAAGHVRPGLLEAVSLAPPGGPVPGVERLDQQAEVAALRHRLADLEVQVQLMKQSPSWRIGSTITRASRAPAKWLDRLRRS